MEQSDEKKAKKPSTGKTLGETLTTDYNGKPLEVRKVTGGCLLKPLQGFCKGPEYQLEKEDEEEQPKDKKKKTKSKTMSKVQ